MPWLLGVTRNLLRKQAEDGRRRRLLTDRVAAMTSAADLVAWDTGPTSSGFARRPDRTVRGGPGERRAGAGGPGNCLGSDRYSRRVPQRLKGDVVSRGKAVREQR
jgi:hypothetical protein